MAKVADVFGRTEAFTISMILYILGYIQQAASRNIGAYASAQIFYAAGSTGLRILQQIFIADTSDLLNRALFSSLPDVPFLVTVWIGPEIAGKLGAGPWRWGYGMWYVLLPIRFSLAAYLRNAGQLLLLFFLYHFSYLFGSTSGRPLKLVWFRSIHGNPKALESS